MKRRLDRLAAMRRAVGELVRRSRRSRSPAPSAAGVPPADVAEMEGRLARVETEARGTDRRLAQRLESLVDRQVPARCVEGGPGRGATRLRFADGMTVLVRGDVPGDVAVLALAMRQQSVVPTACTTDDDGVHLIFGAPGGAFGAPGRRRSLSIQVTGLDQPD